MTEKVIIYTRPDCPFSQKAKLDLKKRGIPYTEIDIFEHPEAKEKIISLIGKKAVPVIVEGEKITIGFEGQ